MTPSPTQELEGLRVRVRELEEELAEWKRMWSDEPSDDIVRIQQALKVTPQQARLALVLSARPGAYQTRNHLHNQIAVGEDVAGNLVSVVVSKLRGRMKAAGWGQPIQSGWGFGYMITPEGARQVRALVEG